jgi:hypothetical protein
VRSKLQKIVEGGSSLEPKFNAEMAKNLQVARGGHVACLYRQVVPWPKGDRGPDRRATYSH